MESQGAAHEKPKFTLSSDASRAELLQRLATRDATVERTSGDVEEDWYVSGIRNDGVMVSKTGLGIEKKIPLGEFKDRNPGLFADIDVTE